MGDFDAAGVAVYALSYDEPEALRDFGLVHGITYTLLSDPDSEIIRSFGILNTLIAEDDHPWFGIPYPGTYVIDAGGAITHKFFDNNLAVRAGPEQLLRAVRGEAVEEAKAEASSPERVDVKVSLDGPGLASTVQRDLVARFRVPADRHVYAAPAPPGTVAAELVLDDDPSLVQRPIVRPASEPHALAGTEESFRVHHDEFELRLPLTVNNSGGRLGPEITISGEVRWQSCDDEVCDIPTSQRFELTLAVAEPPPPIMGNEEGAALEPNALAHFKKMSQRRQGS